MGRPRDDMSRSAQGGREAANPQHVGECLLDALRSLGAWEGQMFNIWKRGCLNKAIRRLLCSAMKEIDWLSQHQRMADTMGTAKPRPLVGHGILLQGRPQSALKPPNKTFPNHLTHFLKFPTEEGYHSPKPLFKKNICHQNLYEDGLRGPHPHTP